MRLSHNSYLIKGDPVKVSVLGGCDIIEADIIKNLLLSHSWRPFGWFTYGNLIDRYLKNFPENKTLYIEFKTGSRSIQEKLFIALKMNGIKKIIVFAKDRNWFMRTFFKREKNLNEFIEKYSNKLIILKMEDFKKTTEIYSIDLFKPSIFHF